MKKLLLFITAIVLTLLIPIANISAQEIVPALTGTSEASPTPMVNYKLPYPGMLPDNSLYKLKILRDKLMLMLIADPHKKAQYHLLLANKQLLMSKMLIDKGNIPLAKDVALKGEHQMTLMTFVYKNASETPKPEFLQEVKLATEKHQELLKEIIQKVSPEDAQIFSTVLEFSQRNIDQLQYLAIEEIE